MAFKLKNTPYPKDKKPKRGKRIKTIEPQLDPEIFSDGHKPYSATSYHRESLDPDAISMARTIGPGSWRQGSGYVEGLDSKLTQNPDGSYTRTQIESSPAYPKRKCRKRKKK